MTAKPLNARQAATLARIVAGTFSYANGDQPTLSALRSRGLAIKSRETNRWLPTEAGTAAAA